jgi:hypothetical protein
MKRASVAGVADLVRAHCMDMNDIPGVFPDIDLLWSEGAAYSIGFSNALTTWATALKPGSFAVVSELSWLREQAPEAVREFFSSGYPEMKSLHGNVALARSAGYEVLATYTLPKAAWVDGYYDVLEPRAKALVEHPDSAVRAFAVETIKEIEVFRHPEESYGYVFYVLQRDFGGAGAGIGEPNQGRR